MKKDKKENEKDNKNVMKEIGKDSDIDYVEEWMKENSHICGLI